jgi:glycosyltransferase involved in cell wall biosynthesis
MCAPKPRLQTYSAVWYERHVPATARPTVAFDVTPLLGVRTGIGNAVAEMYTALLGLDAAPTLVPYTLSLRARQMRQDVPSGTRFVPLPARGLLKAWARANTPRIDRWLAPARVVHATNYLAPASKLPTLVSVYDCSFVRYPELCTPEVLAFVPILRRAIERGATVHTTSEFVATEIEEAFGARRRDGKLVVVPLGVPPLGTEAAMPPELHDQLDGAPFVLAVGTLEPRKNFPHLISAFGALATRHPDLRLVIAGPDGPARPSVESALERLPADVRARVLLPGAVSNEARRALLDGAAVLAYPSIYEGFGFPVLEAMTAGVPVVASRAGAVPEVAGDAILLVDATDEAQLAARIEQVLTEPETRQELVARGRDRVRQISRQDTARGSASFYRRLAEEG